MSKKQKPIKTKQTTARSSNWAGHALLVLSIVVLLYGCIRCWDRTVDDAFITFRYSQNLVDGHGPVFNPGEKLEGYTNPSWMILMAAAIAGGIDPVPASKIAGIACAILMLWVLWRGLRRAAVPGWGAGLAALVLGSSMIVQIWTIAGLETVAFAMLLLAGVLELSYGNNTKRSAVTASLLLIAAALTRPEGLAFWVLGFLGLVVFTRRRSRATSAAPQKAALFAYLLPSVLLILYFAWKLTYYGALLPNTYYVKTGGGPSMWIQGLKELRRFVSSPEQLILLVVAAIGVFASINVKRLRPFGLIAGGSAVLYMLYIISVGGDGLTVHRFYVPLVPFLAFSFGLVFGGGQADLRRAPAWLRTACATAAVIAVAISVSRLHTYFLPAVEDTMSRYLSGNIKLGKFLKEQRSPDTVIAVEAAGAIPFYSGLQTIDMFGLNDHHIARAPFPVAPGGRMMKWDNHYVLSKKPDIIVVNRGYFPADDQRVRLAAQNPTMLISHPMEQDLFARVANDTTYAFNLLRFPDASYFFLFERRTTE